MGSNGGKKEPLSAIKSSRRPRTDTAEAIFGDFWEAPKDSSFHSRGVKKNRKNYKHGQDESSNQEIPFDPSVAKFHFPSLDTQERLTFYEAQGAKPYLTKYPTITSILTEIQPRKWILDLNSAKSSFPQSSVDGREKRKSTKKSSPGLTNEDVPFNKIQFIWNSELDERKRVKLNGKCGQNSQYLLSDPNDLSPIIVNFPHPIQLQNISIPYEVLDPRSVPCGSFVWWDRRVWEYNFVHMARRLSTNDEKSRRKLNIASPITPKKHGKVSEESSGQSPKHLKSREETSNKPDQKAKSPKNGIKK